MDNIQPAQMLGLYRIISQIGRGGMATVYKAYQASIDRYVAIKVLPSQLAESKEFAARFHQEARIIASLEHPHILPVFDYGESDGVASDSTYPTGHVGVFAWSLEKPNAADVTFDDFLVTTLE